MNPTFLLLLLLDLFNHLLILNSKFRNALIRCNNRENNNMFCLSPFPSANLYPVPAGQDTATVGIKKKAQAIKRACLINKRTKIFIIPTSYR